MHSCDGLAIIVLSTWKTTIGTCPCISIGCEEQHLIILPLLMANVPTLCCLRLKCDSVVELVCDKMALQHIMCSQKRPHPIADHVELIKVRRQLELSDAMPKLPGWCNWGMVPSQVWLGIYPFLPPSAVCNLVCACHLFGSDAVLASKVFILCSDAALQVFNFIKCDMRDDVAEYICCAEKRMSTSDGKITFDKWCTMCEEYVRYMEDFRVMKHVRFSFDPDYVIKDWNGMSTCPEDKYDEEQLARSHHFVSIRVEACVSLEFAIIVPNICAVTWKERAIMWKENVNRPWTTETNWTKRASVNHLSIAELDHVAVGLARAGLLDQSHNVRREIFKREPIEHDDVYELGLQYADGSGVDKDLVFADELLRFVFNNGYVDAACAIGYVLADQGAMDEARACWEVGVCNNCVASVHNLGVFYANQGEIAKAKQLLSDASRKGFEASTLELEAINRRGEEGICDSKCACGLGS